MDIFANILVHLLQQEEINPVTLTGFWQQLLGFGVLILGAAAWIVFSLRQSILGLIQTRFEVWEQELQAQKEELKKNTEITERVEGQTNGALAKARNEAQMYRSLYERADYILREVNADANGRAIIDKIMERHRVVVHDKDWDKLQERIKTMTIPQNDPSGLTDAPG